MASQLQPWQSGLPTSRVGRSLSRLSGDVALASASAQGTAEVIAAQVDGVSAVAGKAMQDIALLSQLEQSLAQTTPHASGRLAVVADITATALAGIVADSARRISR